MKHVYFQAKRRVRLHVDLNEILHQQSQSPVTRLKRNDWRLVHLKLAVGRLELEQVQVVGEHRVRLEVSHHWQHVRRLLEDQLLNLLLLDGVLDVVAVLEKVVRHTILLVVVVVVIVVLFRALVPALVVLPLAAFVSALFRLAAKHSLQLRIQRTHPLLCVGAWLVEVKRDYGEPLLLGSDDSLLQRRQLAVVALAECCVRHGAHEGVWGGADLECTVADAARHVVRRHDDAQQRPLESRHERWWRRRFSRRHDENGPSKRLYFWFEVSCLNETKECRNQK